MSRIEELENRLAADPSSRIFVQLAEEYRKQGLFENAIEICEQGLTKHPQYPSARVALGRALLESETFDRAREEFEAVLAQIPDNIFANKFLGETYHRLGRYDEAIQKYQIAQTLAPDDTELEGRIEAVKAEMASRRPPPASAAPEPSERTLEATLVVPRSPAASEVVPTPPPVPTKEEPPAAPNELAELAPIPLVEVDEPMVLESSSQPPASEPVYDAAPPDPVPIVSPIEPPPLEPPPMQPPPVEAVPLAVGPSPVEPLPVEPAAPAQTPASGDDIETPTMAELYASQGHIGKAVVVYRNLFARDPNETQYLERIEELEMLAKEAADSATAAPTAAAEARGDGLSEPGRQQTIEVLELWLDVIRRSRRA